jgi:zinc protease
MVGMQSTIPLRKRRFRADVKKHRNDLAGRDSQKATRPLTCAALALLAWHGLVAWPASACPTQFDCRRPSAGAPLHVASCFMTFFSLHNFLRLLRPFAGLILIATFSALAQPLPAGIEKVTAVEGITEYRLTNGLRVLLFPDSSKPLISVNVVFKVGSRHEGYGEKGMAHLLEHLDFKGTPKHPNIPKELSEHGAQANGTTWWDRTHYYETFDATEKNLRWALELEADRMVNSYIAKKDLDTEFSVVRNEYEMGENNPENVLNKRMMPTVFQWHNYGHDTIGEKSDIEGAPIERLQAFYHNYYQPDNAVLIVAGKFEEQQTLGMIAEYYGSIPKPARQLIPTYTKEPVQDGERQITLRRVGDVQLVSAAYRGSPEAHADTASLKVLANLLVDAPSGPLYKALVESKKAVSVGGSMRGLAEAGVLRFTALLRQDQSLEEAKTALLGVLEDQKNHPPSNEEVEKAKNRLLKEFENSFKDSSSFSIRALTESVAVGDWRMAFVERDHLEKVTPEMVRRAGEFYLKPANRTLGFFIPEKSSDRVETPDAPNLAELMKGYKGKAVAAAGENFDATPANIEKRTTRGALPNGMRYALLPKKTRGALVTASLTFRFGTLETLRGKSSIGGLTAHLLDKGSKSNTRQQIHDAFDKLKAEVHFSGSADSLNVSIKSDREHIADVLGLVAKVVRQPTFPTDEFAILKRENLAYIEEDKTDPQTLADIFFRRASRAPFAKDDPRYILTSEEEAAAVEAVTVDQVAEFYKNFYGASSATVAFVGDFDSQTIETILRESFGDWKNPTPYQHIVDDYQSVPPRNETIATPDKANAVYIAGLGFPMKQDDAEYPALVIGGRIIGGGFLNSRLASRIRQKEGLSYGVSARFSASALDNDGSFWSQMIFNPRNLDKLEIAFREEIEKAAKDGFTADELQQAKSGWLQIQKLNHSSDGPLASTMDRYLFLGRDLTWDAKFEQKVESLTTTEMNAAVHKFLNFSKITTVKAGDFKSALKVQ